MWYLSFLIIGIIAIFSGGTLINDKAFPILNVRARCSKEYQDIKGAVDKSSIVHGIAKVIVGIFFSVYGVVKYNLTQDADFNVGQLFKILLDTGLLANGIDLAVNIYLAVKYKLLTVKDEMAKSITKRIKESPDGIYGAVGYDFKVFEDVKRVTEWQAMEIGIITLALAVFAIIL